jgi:hypothetical protein
LIRPGHLRNSILVASLLFFIFGLSYGLGFGLVSGLSFGLSFGLSAGLSAGLSFGLSFWLLFGFYQGIMQEQVEAQDRRTFNQGIRRSFCNGIFMSLLSGGIAVGIGILSLVLSGVLSLMLSGGTSLVLIFGLSAGPYYTPTAGLSEGLRIVLSDGIRDGLDIGWLLALSGGLVVWATVGGLTVLRHYVIRLLLARSHTFPWRTQAFLDDATARILLYRVGSGYSFVHRRLLDFFAVTVPAIAETLPVSRTPNQAEHMPQTASGTLPGVSPSSDK